MDRKGECAMVAGGKRPWYRQCWWRWSLCGATSQTVAARPHSMSAKYQVIIVIRVFQPRRSESANYLFSEFDRVRDLGFCVYVGISMRAHVKSTVSAWFATLRQIRVMWRLFTMLVLAESWRNILSGYSPVMVRYECRITSCGSGKQIRPHTVILHYSANCYGWRFRGDYCPDSAWWPTSACVTARHSSPNRSN